MPPSLSIVIPSHSRPDLLQLCLAGVRQHATPETEIIVVDDASAGKSVSRVAESFSGVRALRLSRRQGFCVAANLGIRLAQGEIVELLNDDTEVAAGWAAAGLADFEDRTVAAVAPLVLCGSAGQNESPRIDSAGDCYYLGGIAGKRGHGEPLSRDYLQPCFVFGASGSSAFYRQEVLRKVGAFPENFGAYFEDVDLAFRLHRAGYQVRYQPASRVFHRGGASYGTTQRRLLEQQSCNEERVFWRNLPATALRQALPVHLAVLAAKAGRRWEEGGLLPFVLGRLRLLGEIPELRRHRAWLETLGPATDVDSWLVERRFWEMPR